MDCEVTVNRHDMYISLYISDGRGMGHPSAYVYILRLLHRLGLDTGNHYQLSFVPIQWVTDMPICG